MTVDQLFENIFEHPELKATPPILIDIGASGGIHAQWQKIAKYSVCVAFDADNRDMDYIKDKAQLFKQLHVINKIVTDTDEANSDFYLTDSPYCSSLLHPDNENLMAWGFSDLFSVQKKITLPSISLKKTLDSLDIKYLDWFKSDSQGLDLRLFKNLGEMQYNVLIADFEPGFIDAYITEDKINDLLTYMEDMPFWISSFNVCGTQRTCVEDITSFFNQAEINELLTRTYSSPICAEITYINNFKQQQLYTERNYLLSCVFALILKQYAFAAELALRGKSLTGNNLFVLILTYIKQVTAKPTAKLLFTNPAFARQKIINFIIGKLNKLR